jgi:integrase
LLDLEVLPAFRHAALADVDVLAVREWLAKLAVGDPTADPPRRPLGWKRRAKARTVLSMVLASAVEGGKLTKNVAREVKPPTGQRKEMHFLDAGQVEGLAAIDPRYRAMVLFAAYTGVRPSELMALRVGRLDLLRGTARICEAAPEVDGKLEWGEVKTEEARTVHVPRSVAEEAAAMLADRPDLSVAPPSSLSEKPQVRGHRIGRRRWDSNPRGPLGSGDFQGRCLRPLGHSSGEVV